jgi:hypothetical protein
LAGLIVEEHEPVFFSYQPLILFTLYLADERSERFDESACWYPERSQ